MKINRLQKRQEIEQNKKLKSRFDRLNNLLDEINSKDIPDDIAEAINRHVEAFNSYAGTGQGLRKITRKAQSAILLIVEKQLKLVPKNHYLVRWMAIGMSVFGIPLGVIIGIVLDNMAFLAIGIPIGMVLGMAIGAGMDKKAQEDGRQLNFEVNP
ncbi:MAG: hypothetical protein P8100_13140 [bacterium]|jgi:hypothetical protein